MDGRQSTVDIRRRKRDGGRWIASVGRRRAGGRLGDVGRPSLARRTPSGFRCRLTGDSGPGQLCDIPQFLAGAVECRQKATEPGRSGAKLSTLTRVLNGGEYAMYVCMYICMYVCTQYGLFRPKRRKQAFIGRQNKPPSNAVSISVQPLFGSIDPPSGTLRNRFRKKIIEPLLPDYWIRKHLRHGEHQTAFFASYLNVMSCKQLSWWCLMWFLANFDSRRNEFSDNPF